jgi:hypothetical protein
MILRIFEFGGLYYFCPHDAPHGGPPSSAGLAVASHSKFDITRAIIEQAWSEGIAVDAVTGRLADKEAARGCGVPFRDTRSNRKGVGSQLKQDARKARRAFEQKRITRDELNFRLSTPLVQWPLYRPSQPGWRPA